MWLAAENGMFLRPAKGEWMTTMPEHLNMEWIDSVKVLTLMFQFFIFISIITIAPFLLYILLST